MTTNLSPALLRDLKELYEDENDDDYNVILKVGQNSFKAHSVMLKARSKYLRNLINNEYEAFNNKRLNNKRISTIFKKDTGISIMTLEIPHISPNVFEKCLRYIYTGEFSLQEHSNDFIFDLIIAADKLNLKDMVDYLQNHFIKQDPFWIEENLIRIYQTTLNHQNFTELQIHCEKLIEQEPTLIFNSNSFPTLKKTTLLNLIQRDDLSFEEIKIWRDLIIWGVGQEPPITGNISNWNPSDFTKFESRIRDFIPHIRFFTISSEEYYNYVHPFKKALPPKLIEQLLEYYFVSVISPPPNALPSRSDSKYIKREKNNMKQRKKPSTENIADVPLINYNTTTIKRKQRRQTAPPKAPPIVSPIVPPIVPPRFLDFKLDSILINKMQIRHISRWIDGHDNFGESDRKSNPKNNFTLLARGSKDGMEQKMFHFLCDNKGPTLVLAKVDKTNDIIGGYNPKSWSRSNEWIETTESFIFSFKSDGNREGIDDIILSRIKNPHVAIWDGDNSYDIGFSSDLQLFSGDYTCDNYEKSIIDYDRFKIIEYEVFQVN